jgi:hypothetical protein
VLKTLLSVLNIDKPQKNGTMKSEIEIKMCVRMQMYNTQITLHLIRKTVKKNRNN